MPISLADQLAQKDQMSLTEQLIVDQPEVISYPKTDYDDIIKGASDKYDMPYNILYGMLDAESGFDPTKESSRGAKGIAQFMDATAKEQGVDAKDPKSAIPGMAKYWRSHYDKFRKSYDEETSQRMATAAYNAGRANVIKYGGVPPFEETQKYVKKVFKDPMHYGDKVKTKAIMKGKSGLSLTEQLVAKDSIEPIAQISTEITNIPEKIDTPFSQMTSSFIDKSINSLDKMTKDKLKLDEDGKQIEDEDLKGKIGNIAGETLKGLSAFATHPIESIRGIVDIGLSVPGFLVGLVDATVSASKEMVDQVVLGQEFNLEEVYNAASEGMQRSMEFFEPGKSKLIDPILGEMTEESMLASQVVMAPLTGMSMLGHKVANWKGFEDYPNVRGAARFAGDISGILVMGMLVHGKSGKAKFTKDVESVIKKGEEIIVKEQAIESIPNELIKQVQKKVLEVEKVQLELEAKEIANSVNKDALIRMELGRQAEQIAREKIYPVADTGFKPFKDIKEQTKDLPKVEVKPDRLKIEQTEPELKSLDIEKEFGTMKTFKQKDLDTATDKYLDEMYKDRPEPITEVDQATGTKLPGLESES
ncbi:MAG: hypothetical protein DRP42_06465, partial [Tenericutes bacterium]